MDQTNIETMRKGSYIDKTFVLFRKIE